MLPAPPIRQLRPRATVLAGLAAILVAASILPVQVVCAAPRREVSALPSRTAASIGNPAQADAHASVPRAAASRDLTSECSSNLRPAGSVSCLAVPPASATLADAERQGLQHAYVAANLEFTLLHELSHAIFAEFDVPIFGHEEDAADTLATVLMIRRHDMDVSTHESIRLLAVSEEWRLAWASDKDVPNLPYWDAHALAIQRYYNVNCLLAGANPSALHMLLDTPELPSDRGLYCRREFQQAKQFALWLLAEYGRPAFAPGTAPQQAIDVKFDPPRSTEQAALAAWLRDDDVIADIFRRAGDFLAWREPISVEFVSCGEPDSYYNDVSRTIVICYELPVEFSGRADLILRSRSIDEFCANRPLRYLLGEWIRCESHDLTGS
jgi:hypothetical protein